MKDSQLAHPLFPAEGDEPPPRIERIHVARDEPAGGQKFCPHMFGAEELQDLEQIERLFGGGSYELWGYAGGKISRRRRYRLDGKPRPLTFATEAQIEEAPPVAPVPTPGHGGTDLGTMMMIFKMMQDQQQASMQVLGQVMAAALSRPAPDPGAGLAQVVDLLSRQQSAQTELLTRVLTAGDSGPTSRTLDMFERAIEFGRKTAATADGDGESGGIDAIAETVGAAVTAFQAASQMQAATQAGPPQPDPPQLEESTRAAE